MKLELEKSASLEDLKRAPKQLFVGLAIMLLCSVFGGVILNTQNKTETLLVLNRDVAAGDAVNSDYFDSREVLVSTLNSQWLTPEEVSTDSFFAIPLSKGDALRAADVSKMSSGLRLISFGVEQTDLPSNLSAGDLIDFWNIGIGSANLIADSVAVQSISLDDSRGVYQVSLLVDLGLVDAVLSSISNETQRLVVSV